MKKKVLSILLVICMVVGMLPATVFAAGESADEGICPHHPEHTPECGYAPATDGSASCTHVHDGNCGYTVITPGFPCNHYHDWFDCYIDNCSHACDCNGAPSCPNYPMCDGFKHDETCDPGNQYWGDYACGHDAECGIATGCKQLNCSHKHGDDCTFVAEVGEGCTHVHDDSCGGKGTEGSPCTFDCALCDQDEPAAGKFHVTYDANGGEGTTEDANEYAADATVTVLANSFTRDGYTFTGWNTAADGSGTAYAPEATLTLSADLTLYAQWAEEEETEKFTVTYDANGGEGTTVDANEYAAGATVTVLANSFTLEGYTFTGWNTAADGSGTAYAPEATLTLSADLTLYAQWEEEEAEKFTVTYNANGGEGTTEDANEYAADATVTILDSSFILEGHTFTGWNTAADGSGTDYAAGDEVAISADLILYAQWEAEGHSHCVCGKTHRPIGSHSAESVQTWRPLAITSGTLSSGSYYLEDNVTITGTITISGTVNLCLNGKSLNGNNANTILKVNGGGVLNITDCIGSGVITGNRNSSDIATINVYGGRVNMYGGSVANNSAYNYGNIFLDGGAVFTLNGGSIRNNTLTVADGTYGGGGVYVRTATFIMNGGSITGNSNVSAYGGGIYCTSYAAVYINGGTISGNSTPKKGDGIFYSSRAGNDGKLYIGGAPYIADEIYLDNTGNAKYPYITSAIRNQLNLVVESFAEGRVVAEGSGYTLTETDLTRISLKGANGTTYYCKLVKENNQIIMTATDPGYTAKYLVIYDGNGGTGSIADSKEYAVGDTATVKSNSFTLEDYTFVGWNTKADGTGTSYAPGDEVTISADLILYAQWEIGEFTATFQVAGGTAPANQVVSYEGKLTKPADPTVEGKNFKGWLYKFESDADWSTEYWNFDTDVVTENVTLKADFKLAGILEFSYAYDVYRTPDFPEKDREFTVSNLSAPYGADGSTKVANAGEWTLVPVGLYADFKNTAAHSTNTYSVVSGTASAFGVTMDSLTIYELFNGDEHYAYGTLVIHNVVDGIALFCADNRSGSGTGYLFTKEARTDGFIVQPDNNDDRYSITVATTSHGTVVASTVSAAAGATVNLTITPDVGYEVDTISVKTAAGADVTVTGSSFTMPAANVVVTVTFKTAYVQPNYTVIIPENMDVKLNDLTTVLGKIKVTITNLDPTNLIKVALDSDCELVHEDDDDKTIPYSVKAGNEEFTFATYEQTGETELTIHITQEDWDKAFSGKYTDTINFVISVITKN